MTATAAKIGYGSKFSVWDSSLGTPAFVDVAEVISITPPSTSVDTVDATHMGSSSATREFIAGLIDPGETSFEMNYVPGSSSETLLLAVLASRTPTQCKITFPGSKTWTFTGIMTKLDTTAPLDGKMTSTATFKLTTSVTHAG